LSSRRSLSAWQTVSLCHALRLRFLRDDHRSDSANNPFGNAGPISKGLHPCLEPVRRAQFEMEPLPFPHGFCMFEIVSCQLAPTE
jgi:hypothetical protein